MAQFARDMVAQFLTAADTPALREPEQIRQDCVRKLRPIETSGMFTAILGVPAWRGLTVSLRLKGSMGEVPDVTFGREGKGVWIVLTYQEPASGPGESSVSDTTPPDSWFDRMIKLSFGGEKDVEHLFLQRLFEQLGYEDADFAFGFLVVMYQGCKNVTTEADVVLFNGESRNYENALILAETKSVRKLIDKRVKLQARSYANWLSPVYYVLTDGDDVEV